MKKYISILILSLIIISCSINENFDSEKWKSATGEDLVTNVRGKMITDLIESRILVNMPLKDVYSILGNKRLSDEKLLKYLVIEKYEVDIDPEYYDYLIVEFDEKLVVDSVYVKRVY